MRLLFVLAAACSLSLVGQNVAVYPGALATCADLPVAGNLASTILTQSINSGDTTINVVSTAAFPQIVGPCASIIVVDQGKALAEVIRYCGLTPTTFTVCADGKGGRGFDGTAAMAHSTAAPVNGYVVADHVNQIAAEVSAIENRFGINPTVFPALTPQLGYLRVKPNVTPNAIQFSTLPTASSADYIFPTQSPSGTLTAATPATVTLTPVPLGVNGSDTNHYLRIPTCSGGAQQVLITGGTAVSGNPLGGTITFTPTNSCTAGWTITSATSGIQEAINSTTLGSSVQAPLGVLPVYAPIYVAQALRFTGSGQDCTGGTTLQLQGDIVGFSVNVASAVNFSTFCVTTTAGSPTVATGIKLDAPASGAVPFARIQNCNFIGLAIGIDAVNAAHTVIIGNYIQNTKLYGIRLQSVHISDTGNTYITNNEIAQITPALNSGTAAIYHTSGGGVVITGNGTFGFNYGYYLQSNVGTGSSGLQIIGNGFAAAQIEAIHIEGTQPYHDATIANNQVFSYSTWPVPNWIGLHVVSGNNDTGAVSGNLFFGEGTATQKAVQIDTGSNWMIGPNNIIGVGTGITIGAGGLGNEITTQQWQGVTTPIQIGGIATKLTLPVPLTFAQIGALGATPVNGSMVYCSDCTIANPCAALGSGAIMKILNTVKVCN